MNTCLYVPPLNVFSEKNERKVKEKKSQQMAESIVQTPLPDAVGVGDVAGDVADQLVTDIVSGVAASDTASVLAELSSVKKELEAARRELQSKAGDASEQKNVRIEDTQAKLDVAYEQIAMLNTQMAHLYTELTFARTGGYRNDNNGQAEKQKFETDLHKRSEQIGVLVQDIRHLQADLEYHQECMADLRTQKEQESAKSERLQHEKDALQMKLEEAELALKHQAIDRAYFDSLKKDDPSSAVAYDFQRERAKYEREVEKCTRLSAKLQKALVTVDSQQHKIQILDKQLQKVVRMSRLPRERKNLPNITPRSVR